MVIFLFCEVDPTKDCKTRFSNLIEKKLNEILSFVVKETPTKYLFYLEPRTREIMPFLAGYHPTSGNFGRFSSNLKPFRVVII